MLLNRKIRLVILLFILLQSCIEPFMPETAKYDYNIFIEALVTDEFGMLPEVSISSTIPLNTSKADDVASKPDTMLNAEVILLCDDGTEYKFDKPERSAPNSKYKLSDPNFSAEPGKSYKIIIYLDGEVFESDFETLKESPAIDSIGYKVKTMKLAEDGITVEGYQFLVSNHSNESGPFYYRWLLDATYSYITYYDSDYKWDMYKQRLIPYVTNDGGVCWKDKNIRGIYISSTERLSENAIIKAPLNFESQYGDELTTRYSLHVKQLAISKESYIFWNEVNKMVYQSGGLFEKQPFKITGNITCTSNPDLSVIGIFEVAGVSEFREFFNRPTEFQVQGYKCKPDTIDNEKLPLVNLDHGAYVFDVEISPLNIIKLTSSPGCFECIGRGGSNKTPPFWEF
jgi:hypothetical protein